jgi:hypothetical protein
MAISACSTLRSSEAFPCASPGLFQFENFVAQGFNVLHDLENFRFPGRDLFLVFFDLLFIAWYSLLVLTSLMRRLLRAILASGLKSPVPETDASLWHVRVRLFGQILRFVLSEFFSSSAMRLGVSSPFRISSAFLFSRI